VPLPPRIADYYRAALDAMKAEIDSTPDDHVLGMDPAKCIEYVLEKYGMIEVVFNDAAVELIEVDREYRQQGYDIYSDRGPGTLVRETAVRIQLPVEPSDTIQTIWAQRLAPSIRANQADA